MSYFINPDGTVEFVADKYDSAGNISYVQPYSMIEIDAETRKQVAKPRRRNVNISSRSNGTTRLGENIVFRNGVFYPEDVVIKSKHDVKALQRLLENNMYKMTYYEANIIRRKIKDKSALSSFDSRFGIYNNLL